VPIGDSLAERESDPRAGVFVPAVKPLEHFENPILIVGIDTDPLVADREDPLVTGPGGRDVDARRLVAAIFDGVLDRFWNN
jgi:hypothetical protein